jgi:hypothetical protein
MATETEIRWKSIYQRSLCIVDDPTTTLVPVSTLTITGQYLSVIDGYMFSQASIPSDGPTATMLTATDMKTGSSKSLYFSTLELYSNCLIVATDPKFPCLMTTSKLSAALLVDYDSGTVQARLELGPGFSQFYRDLDLVLLFAASTGNQMRNENPGRYRVLRVGANKIETVHETTFNAQFRHLKIQAAKYDENKIVLSMSLTWSPRRWVHTAVMLFDRGDYSLSTVATIDESGEFSLLDLKRKNITFFHIIILNMGPTTIRVDRHNFDNTQDSCHNLDIGQTHKPIALNYMHKKAVFCEHYTDADFDVSIRSATYSSATRELSETFKARGPIIPCPSFWDIGFFKLGLVTVVQIDPANLIQVIDLQWRFSNQSP